MGEYLAAPALLGEPVVQRSLASMAWDVAVRPKAIYCTSWGTQFVHSSAAPIYYLYPLSHSARARMSVQGPKRQWKPPRIVSELPPAAPARLDPLRQ